MQPIKGLVQLPINMLNVARALAVLASGFTSLIYFGFIFCIFPRSTILTLIEYITDYKLDYLVSNFITSHIENLRPDLKKILVDSHFTYDINGIKQFVQINEILKLGDFSGIMDKLVFKEIFDDYRQYNYDDYRQYINFIQNRNFTLTFNEEERDIIDGHLKVIESINAKFNIGLYFLPQSYFASKALSIALLKPLPTDTSDVVLSILYKFSILILAVPLLMLTIVSDIILYAPLLLPLAVYAITYLTQAIFIVTITIPLYIAEFLNSIFAFETGKGLNRNTGITGNSIFKRPNDTPEQPTPDPDTHSMLNID